MCEAEFICVFIREFEFPITAWSISEFLIFHHLGRDWLGMVDCSDVLSYNSEFVIRDIACAVAPIVKVMEVRIMMQPSKQA